MTDFPDLFTATAIAIDTETTGLRPDRDRVFGLCVAALRDNKVEGWYWDVREQPEALAWLKDTLEETDDTPIIMANANFDCRFLFDIMEPHLHRVQDVQITAKCCKEDLQSYSLDALAERYLRKNKVKEIYPELAKMFGGRATRNVQMPNLQHAPPSLVAPYGIADAVLTLELWQFYENAQWQKPELRQIIEFESKLISTFVEFEHGGIRVDVPRVHKAMEVLRDQINEEHERVNKLAGKEINVNSSQQVRQLFELNQGSKDDPEPYFIDVGTQRIWIGETSTGNPSISASALHAMADAGHELAAAVVDLRSLIKTRDTFLAKHILEHQTNGRVRASIKQFGTTTGRLAIREPALQQIPSRNKKAAEIVKSCFLPNEGHVWLDADQSSFEVRVFAGLVNDPKIVQAYIDDPETDFHQFVADLTGLPRSASRAGEANAKQLNLSMIFNSGRGSIANEMGLPWEWSEFEDEDTGEMVRYRKAGPEANEVIDRYHDALPGVQLLAERCKHEALTKGYVQTVFGRKMRFPDPKFAYKASGLLIQATAADYNKITVELMHRVARSYGGQLLLNTHDSYSISLPEKHLKSFWRSANREMDKAFGDFPVPFLLELSGVGHNWWLALKNELNVTFD